MTLPVKPLGSQGLTSSVQGLGCMGMSWAYVDKNNPVNDEESLAVIDRALELGVCHLDTSDIYGSGENEKLISKALKGRRDKFMLATKFGLVLKDGKLAVDGSAKHVREACEASLARLETEYIDLYYLHRVDRTVPIKETFGEMKKLVEEGKVKYLGISEASAAEIRKAHAVHPISAVQLEWSLFTRDAEEEIIPTCRELGIGIVAYSPLGRGLLTGAITSTADLDPTDWRATNPRLQGENFDANLALVQRVQEVAGKKGVTAGQLALAWVHSQGNDVFPIPGTKRIKYLEQNVAAAKLNLTAEDKAPLQDVSAKVKGMRYTADDLKAGHEGYAKASQAREG